MSKLIPLTKGYNAIVDDEDFEKLNQYKWYAQERHNSVYAYRRMNKTKKNLIDHVKIMHREILNLKNSKYQVDHINHNGLDNRKLNLRICNKHQNSMNKPKDLNKKTKSKYKGVRKSSAGNTWQAQINFKGKYIYLGCFKTEKEAALTYNKAAVKYFKKFAYLNEV